MFIKSGIYFLDHNLMHCLATVHCIMIALVKKRQKVPQKYLSGYQIKYRSPRPPSQLGRGCPSHTSPPWWLWCLNFMGFLFSFSKVGIYGCIWHTTCQYLTHAQKLMRASAVYYVTSKTKNEWSENYIKPSIKFGMLTLLLLPLLIMVTSLTWYEIMNSLWCSVPSFHLR